MNNLFVGFRIEMSGKFLARNFVKRYNNKYDDTKIIDICNEGKIIVKKREKMLLVSGKKVKKGFTGLINFSLMVPVETEADLDRIIQIVNVLGNDRLIKERVSLFVAGKSKLNYLPQLNPIKQAFIRIENMMPGFIRSAWYYVPEAVYEIK